MEYIHNKSFIHRDIKPENFMSGRKEYKDVVYLIDFGLSKKYRDPKTGQHVKFVNHRRLNGTARYASIHALEGYETSRRDDLEELSYVLIYLLNGHLPWERIRNKNKHERYKLILNMKKKITEVNLVGDKNNKEFVEFLKYCKKLKFEEKPDYDYLRGILLKAIEKNNKSIDNFYNIDLNKNKLFISSSKEKKNKRPIKEYNCRNVSPNISCKNTKSNSTRRIKINLSSNKINQNENSDNIGYIEDDDYYNKIIDESKSSSLGNIEKKIRNYSSFKKHGIKEIQSLINLSNKHKQLKNNPYINYIRINKNQTAYRSTNNILNRIKCTSLDSKKVVRTRFNLIKKSFGITQNNNETFNNDSNEMFKMKKQMNNIRSKNNISDNNSDDICIIL